MTLGCGGWGGNITSDNISPKHLLNIKRLAYETQPAKGSVASDGRDVPGAERRLGRPRAAAARRPQPGRPRAAHRPVPRLPRDCEPRTDNPEPEPERGTRNRRTREPATDARAGRIRVRGRCPAGTSVRRQNRAGQPDDCDPGRARSGRGETGVRRRALSRCPDRLHPCYW